MSRDVPEQRVLSRDICSCPCPGTKGQRDKEIFLFFVLGQRDNGTSHGNPSSNQQFKFHENELEKKMKINLDSKKQIKISSELYTDSRYLSFLSFSLLNPTYFIAKAIKCIFILITSIEITFGLAE